MKAIDPDELRDLLHGPDVIPPGWKTQPELAKEWGMGLSTVGKYLRAGVDAGKVEQRSFRRESGRKPVPHYRRKG